jgi:hypothetical protein
MADDRHGRRVRPVVVGHEVAAADRDAEQPKEAGGDPGDFRNPPALNLQDRREPELTLVDLAGNRALKRAKDPGFGIKRAVLAIGEAAVGPAQ